MKRLQELDSLRGLAALSVLFLHYTLSYGTEIGWTAGKPLVVFSLARTGVAIFFVISGFVIYHSLQRAETLRDFAVARFARLYPAYYTCMAMTGVIVFLAGFNFRHVHYADALVNLTMATPIFARVTLEPTYWTLTRELLFYALIAGLAFGFGKGRVVAGSAIWIVVAIVVNVFVADASHFAVTGWRSEVELITNAQFGYLFCSGMMLYRISIGDRSKLVVATLALAIVSAGFSEWADRGRFGFKEVGVAMIDVATVAAVVVWRPRFMRWSVLIWFGAISYSLYLIHQTLGFYIISHLQNHGVNANLAVLVAAMCAISVAALVQKFVEVPAQRAIRRWMEPGATRTSAGHIVDLPVAPNVMAMPQPRSS